MQINPEDPIVRDAVFGTQVEQFLSSDIGIYLMQRADDFAQDAIDSLTRADPEDAKVIRALQNKIHLADMIASWLKEAMAMGEQAQNHIREQIRQ